MKKHLFLTIFLSTLSYSQSAGIEELAVMLQEGGTGASLADLGDLASSGDNTFEYESFNQAKYLNIVNQIKKVDESKANDVFISEVRKKQVQLAYDLCEIDENACELLENYKNYKESKKPKDKKLDIFGVDLFYGYPLSFNQTDSGGAPANYRLNIGDQLRLQVITTSPINASGFIDSQGGILVPNIGVVTVAGMTIPEAKVALETAVQSKLLGAQIILSLNSINTIQVYSLGLVNSPGAYKLSGTSKAINGIIASGGFKTNSSLRNIKIMRGDTLVSTLDLYDFLIKGISGSDLYLQNDDTILVSAKSYSAYISGEVGRPAIYELKEGETYKDLLNFALGFTEIADKNNISLRRKNEYGQYKTTKVVYDENFQLKNGDQLIVGTVTGEWIDSVKLLGTIRNAGDYQFSDGDSLGSLIKLDRDLLNETYMPFISIKRFNQKTRAYSFLAADLLSQERLNSFPLQRGDEVYVFNNNDVAFINSFTSRSFLTDKLDDLLAENAAMEIDVSCFSSMSNFSGDDFLETSRLKFQVFNNSAVLTCTDLLKEHPVLTPILLNRSIPVFGDITTPGLYPTSSYVNASQMLEIAGGKTYSPDQKYKYQIGTYDSLEASSKIDLSGNNLKYIGINGVSSIATEAFVTVVGEFKFPGTYKISSNTTLLDLYDMAGELTESAFPHGGILSRKSILQKESQLLKQSEKELAEIIASGVTSGVIKQSSTDLLGLVGLINQLGTIEPTGRVVTEFEPAILKRDQNKNIFLKPGDTIYMPRLSNTVTISGSVLNPITVPYNPDFSLNDYIEMSGGYTDASNEEKTFIILANGQSIKNQKYNLFGLKDSIIRPGATIIVPRNARPLGGLSLVEAITPILANLSITMASIVSITDRN
ncbi:SLBB domain-containing protein [Gammaproteobacteria bacterium]|nr:SLBB domain-containing protein [Gammaproteobacteria bacterium]